MYGHVVPAHRINIFSRFSGTVRQGHLGSSKGVRLQGRGVVAVEGVHALHDLSGGVTHRDVTRVRLAWVGWRGGALQDG